VPPLRSWLKPQPGFVSLTDRLYNGLICAYFLNEGGGLKLNEARLGNTATLSSTFNWTTGNAGPAVNFNGGVSTGPTTAIDPFSVALWIKITNLGGGNQICVAKAGSMAFAIAPQGGGWNIYFDGTFLIFRACAADNSNVQGQIAISDTKWHMFAWSWDKKVIDATSQGFFDGVPVTMTTSGSFGASTYATDATFPLYFGSFNTATPLSNGQLGSFFAWNRRITASEANDLFIYTYPAQHPRIGVKSPSTNFTQTLNASMSTFSGSLTKQTSRTLNASMATFAGALAKQTSRILTASMATFAATVTSAKALIRTLTATMFQMAGALTKNVGKALTAGMSTFSATLTHVFISGANNKTFTAGMATFAGALTFQDNKALNASMALFSATLSLAVQHGTVPPVCTPVVPCNILPPIISHVEVCENPGS
jgi:hypothetical protein